MENTKLHPGDKTKALGRITSNMGSVLQKASQKKLSFFFKIICELGYILDSKHALPLFLLLNNFVRK